MEDKKKLEQISELFEQLIGNLQFCTNKLQEIALQKPNEWNKQELEKELTVISAVVSTTLMELGKLIYLLLGE